MNSFYWHDYETWGAKPSVDRPSQFAGVRTDEQLNIISEPLVIYCRPPEDIWPHPEACLITKITPQYAKQHGLVECEFIRKIHNQFSEPGTCAVGYNSLRFDDEVSRYTLYRNFYDPYEREWRNGNSRWDIIDMVRLVYALRPEGIEWPTVDDKPSFKLENISKANGIVHQSAHDAFSDVEATIALAKLIKLNTPALYDYVLRNKSKQKSAEFIDIKNRKPLLHISSKFPSERGCAGLIAPLAMHPVNRNAVIAYDLSADPSPLESLNAEEIRERVFTSQDELPEGVERLPIKLIHLNKCPILATPKLLDEKASQRLGINKNQCEKHWQMIKKMDVSNKLETMYRSNNFVESSDPEQQLYNSFIKDRDKKVMNDLRQSTPKQLTSNNYIFEDRRLQEMLGRYKARNYAEYLPPQELEEWYELVRERLTEGGDGRLSRAEFGSRIAELLPECQDEPSRRILAELQQYIKLQSEKYAII